MAEELQKLLKHAEQIAQRENCFLYDLELSGQGGHRTLRVFIDKKGEESVSIDDCSRVSRGLDLVLDVEDLVPGGAYQLEVSSPGLERHLKQPWHFESAIGETVTLQLIKALGEFCEGRSGKDEKRKKITGTLTATTADGVQLNFSEEADVEDLISVPYQCIHKARVVIVYPETFKDKKKLKKGRKG